MINKNFQILSSKETFKVIQSIKARTQNTWQGTLKNKLFFLHINKCGGSSINQAIKCCYYSWNLAEDRNLVHLKGIPSFIASKIKEGKTEISPTDEIDEEVLKFRENILLYYMSQKDIKYISGHFSFSNTAYRHFFQQYSFITVLREPVSRWISSYFYNRYKQINYCKINTDIEDYLNSDIGRLHGCEYIKLLNDPYEYRDYTSQDALEQAKENLHKFSLVGCLEYQKEFIEQFAQRFGKQLFIPTINKSPKSNRAQKSIVTEEIKEKIREICKPDLEIYQYAVENFVKNAKKESNKLTQNERSQVLLC